MKTKYLNTDLEVLAKFDLTALAAAFKSRRCRVLSLDRLENGNWHATIETGRQFREPERNVAALLALIDALPELELALWRKLMRREFDIGYQSGSEPGFCTDTLSAKTLARMADAGVSLRISLYTPNNKRTSAQPPS